MVPDLMLYITHLLTEFHRLPGHLWRKEWNSMRYAWCPHACTARLSRLHNCELYLLADCSVLMTCVVEATTVVKWDLASLEATRKGWMMQLESVWDSASSGWTLNNELQVTAKNWLMKFISFFLSENLF